MGLSTSRSSRARRTREGTSVRGGARGEPHDGRPGRRPPPSEKVIDGRGSAGGGAHARDRGLALPSSGGGGGATVERLR